MTEKIDMSAKAVTTRLKRVAQLRRLGLSLQKASIKQEAKPAKVTSARKTTKDTNQR